MNKLGISQAAALLNDPVFLSAVIEAEPGDRSIVRAHFPRGCELDDALKELVRKRKAVDKRVNEDADTVYREQDLAIIIDADPPIQLSNFVCRIDKDELIDDGVEPARVFQISGASQSGTNWSGIAVSPSELTRSGWHINKLGATAILSALPRADAHLLAAMQALSTPEKVTVYQHTGWREVNGEYCYLHAGGAVGSTGLMTQLDGQLSNYRLPDASEDPAGAVRWALRMLDVGPRSVVLTLFLCAIRAPLSSILPMDAAVHVVGATGSRKSSIVALLLSFFGSFTHDHLPASWNDTEAALECYLSRAKDTLAVIDDWSPKSSDLYDETRRKGNQVFRAVGNRSSRHRMRADLSARPPRPPRGLIVSTGEDAPTEESILARILLVPVKKLDIDNAALATMQRHSDKLTHAMRAYIEWIRLHYEVLPEWLRARHVDYRSRLQRPGQHLRSASAAAHLAIAAEVFARFAIDIGVFSHDQARMFISEAETALMTLISDQGSQQRDTDPALRFVSCLMELEAQGVVALLPVNGHGTVAGGSSHVGWRDDSNWFLLPSVAYRAVFNAMRQGGEAMPLIQRTLWARLHEVGVLCREEHGTFSTKRKFSPVRVIRLKLDRMRELAGLSQAQPLAHRMAPVRMLPLTNASKSEAGVAPPIMGTEVGS